MPATEHVILVDKNDNPVGVAEKFKAHRDNLCHRAFSIFILQKLPNPLILLQQRAATKYHSANLWTNTCCSHPRPHETLLTAGNRRLNEEMGFTADLHAIGRFHYMAALDNGLTENEVDHVLIGTLDNALIVPNPYEVQAYRWVTVETLEQELIHHPENFTVWLKPALEFVKLHLQKLNDENKDQ